MTALHHLDIPIINPMPFSLAFSGLTDIIERHKKNNDDELERKNAKSIKLKEHQRKSNIIKSQSWINQAYAAIESGIVTTKHIGETMIDKHHPNGVERCCAYRRMVYMEKRGLVIRIGNGVDTTWSIKK